MGCAELHEAVGIGTGFVLREKRFGKILCGQSNKLTIRSDGVGN